MNALETKVNDAAIGELPDKYAIIVFDRAGNPLEVFYNQVDDYNISVFHAMKLRNSTIKMLNI